MKTLIVYHPQLLMAVRLKDLIDVSGGFTVARVVCSPEDLYTAMEVEDVDMLLISASSTNTGTVKMVRAAKAISPDVSIIVYSQGEITSLFSYMSYSEGVAAFLPADADVGNFMALLNEVALGEYKTPKPRIEGRGKKLSARETEVLNLLVEGMSSKEISCVLGIADKTVSTYKQRLFNKLNVKTVVELVAQYNSASVDKKQFLSIIKEE